MASIQLRGAELRSWSGKIEEGGPVHRLKFLSELSRKAARDLGCEDVFFEGDGETIRESPVEIKVKRSMRVEEFKIEPNGMKQHAMQLTGKIAEFELYTVQGEEESDPPEGHIRVSISTDSPFAIVEQYIKIVGTQDGVLRIKLSGDKQMKLGEDAPAEDAEEPDPAKPIPSMREMGEKTRKKRTPPPASGAAESTAEVM